MSKLSEKLYDSSPAFLQNLAVSYYGFKLLRREYGAKFRKALAEFEANQWLSVDELREYQNEKLRAIIKHSYENVPYYRKKMDALKLRPDDIKTIDDLPKMPILTREDIKANFDELTARNFKRSELIIGHTSGTTGSPLEFYYDRQICLIKNVVDWRVKTGAGINFGDRIAFFLGRMVVPITQKKPPFWRSNYVFNHVFFSSFHMSADNLGIYLDHLNRIKPSAVEGYPSTVYIMARYLLSVKKTFPVKAVFTSSETLLPIQRETIEKAFGCKLYDFYGLAERVAFAGECPSHQGHHINMDFGISEIIDKDGQPCSPGQMGRLVATGLHNYGMPIHQISHKRHDRD